MKIDMAIRQKYIFFLLRVSAVVIIAFAVKCSEGGKQEEEERKGRKKGKSELSHIRILSRSKRKASSKEPSCRPVIITLLLKLYYTCFQNFLWL